MLKSLIVVIVVVIVVGAFLAQILTKMAIWAKKSRLPSVHVQIALKMHVLLPANVPFLARPPVEVAR